jgi:hypothetical protein
LSVVALDTPGRWCGLSDAATECAALLVALLGSSELALRMEAAASVSELCAGEGDKPVDAVICDALLHHGLVPALLHLLQKETPKEAGAVDADACDEDAVTSSVVADGTLARFAALRALATLVSLHAPARFAVAAADGIPVLVAALREPDDDELVDGAVRILSGVTNEPALLGAVREAGGAQPLVALMCTHAQPGVVAAAADAVANLCDASVLAAVEEAGASALVTLLHAALRGGANAYVSEACARALWNVAEESAAGAAALHASGAIPALLQLLRQRHAAHDCDGEAASSAVGALLAMANHEFLHAPLVDADVLSAVVPVVRSTTREDSRLLALLLLACAYSSPSSARAGADALLREHDVTTHVKNVLVAAASGCEEYLHVCWSARDACMYARVLSASTADAMRLAALGAPALLLRLLAAAPDAVVQQHACRALLNFALLPELLPTLRDAGAADVLRPLTASADEQTASAANAVLLHLPQLPVPAAAVAEDPRTPLAAPQTRCAALAQFAGSSPADWSAVCVSPPAALLHGHAEDLAPVVELLREDVLPQLGALRRELTELRLHVERLSRIREPPAQAVLLPIWITACGTTSCVGMVAVLGVFALQAMRRMPHTQS